MSDAPADPPLFYQRHLFFCNNQRAENHPRGSCNARAADLGGVEKLRAYARAKAQQIGIENIRCNGAGAGMRAVTMACNSGATCTPWALPAHAGWFQTGWCDAANSGSVDRQPLVDRRRSQRNRPYACCPPRMPWEGTHCRRPGSWCGYSDVPRIP
jgi:hypothetical protein